MPTRRVAFNIIMNWVAMATSMAVAFFLSPFLVHRLGPVAYGVWVLVISANMYLGLLDLGIRGAVIRFVAQGNAVADHEKASQSVTAALWIRIWISGGILLLAFIFAPIFPRLFHVPEALVSSSRLAVMVTAFTMIITLTFGLFGAVISALQRYDIQAGLAIGQALLRSGSIVWAIMHGHGILALAICELVTTVLVNLAAVYCCRIVYPQLTFSLRKPPSSVFRAMWNYSLYLLISAVAVQLVYYTDNFVVGAFTSASSVTLYAIGGNVISYLRQIVTSMTATFQPLSSSLDARGSTEAQRTLLYRGTRATLIVGLPVLLGLFIRGETFIRLWMGPQYSGPSSQVMRLLLIAHLFVIGNLTTAAVAQGIAKHQKLATFALTEGACNLALSILLVRHMGIYGVALGTMIPSIVMQSLWPPFICKALNIRLFEYIWSCWLRPILGAIPFAVACWLADRYWYAASLKLFFLQMISLLPAYFFVTILLFSDDLRSVVPRRKRSAVA